MVRKSTLVLAAFLAAVLAAPTSAVAAPCSAAAKADLKITDAAGGGSLYATHPLSVTGLPVGQDTSIDPRTVSAPGARRLDSADPEQSDPPTFVRDTPGPLTVSAVVDTTDPSRPADDSRCSAAVSKTVQLRPALAPLISIKRPRKGRAGNGDLIYPDPPTFRITVKHRTGSNRMPITVRARATRRRKLPKKSAKAATQIFAQRPSDFVEDHRKCPLICPRKTKRGFSKSTEVIAFPIESSKLFSNGLRVQLIPPTGYPGAFRHGRESFIRTPFGADVELLQGGKRIARLRVVALCNGSGQSSRCRFRKISTKR